MKLNKKQKEHLLALVAEGLQSDEINRRAARFKPAYSVSRQQVDFYRDSRKVKLDELKEASESGALKSGFALKERRVEVLSDIAERIYQDLQGGIRERAAFEFKEAEIRQLRGVFDDLAKEAGDRKQKVEHSDDADAPLTIRVEYEDA
jgi:hypothetical protein